MVFSTVRSANSQIRCENVDCLPPPKIEFFRIKMAATICFCFGLGFRTKNCKQIGVLRIFHQFFIREQVVKLTVKFFVVEN